MSKISLESVDLVITRKSNNEFHVKLGDLVIYEDKYELEIGDTMTLNIPSMLVLRDEDTAKCVEID